MSKVNGGIIGGDNTPNIAVASGMWSTSEITKYVRQSFWPPTYFIPIPNLFLDFQSTTILDPRISFTRATNGTYFNSSGVLTTAGSGVARFDHRLENGSWVNKGLLIEEARTNGVRNNTMQGAVAGTPGTAPTNWVVSSAGGNLTTRQIVGTGTENGINYIDIRFVASGTVEANIYVDTSTGIAASNGQTWTCSYFVKLAGGSLTNASVFTSLIENNSSGNFLTGADGAAFIPTNAALNTQRITQTRTNTNASTAFLWTRVKIFFSGAGDLTIRIGMPQVERGAFATSTIATTSASVTRNADVASMTGTNFSSWYNQTEGTVFWQGDLIGLGKAVSNAAAARGWAITDGTANERHFLNAESQFSGETLTTTGAYSVIDNNVTLANFYSPSTPDNAVANFTYKYASAYKVNDFALSLNGNSVTIDTTGTIPTVNKLELGHELEVNTLVLCGHIANFSYWPARLTNGQLQYISQNGYINQNLALVLNFDQTTILDPRISFTRATNGTYFNSSGVLTTAGSGVARFDHRLENGSWVNKGLLIEEARTNLFQRSEEFDDVYWTKNEVTVTANSTTAPDGATTAERVRETTTNGFHQTQSTNINLNLTSTPYTASCFVKADGKSRGSIQLNFMSGSFPGIYTYFNLDTGTVFSTGGSAGTTVIGASIQNVGNGWYRVSISGFTGQSGNHTMNLYLLNDSNQFSYAGDTSKGMFYWGAQLEAGAFPTSYIKTTSASVTRNADLASMTGTNFSSWYNATEGTIFNQIGNNSDPNGANDFNTLFHYAISNNTNNERLQASSSFFNSNNQIGFGVFDDAISQLGSNLSQPISFSRLQDYRGAFAYKLNDFASSVNGSNVLTDNSGSLPTVDRIYFGTNPEGITFLLNGCLSKFYYWNIRKPDNFLIGVTK